MYKFEWGVEEEKNYDLRAYKCGGWASARIQTRRTGNWQQFYDGEKTPINQPFPIDYKKKYVPPKRPKTAIEHPKKTKLDLYQDALATLSPQTVREIVQSTVSSTTYNTPPFNESISPIRIKPSERGPLSSIATSRSINTSRSKTSMERAQTSRTVKTSRTISALPVNTVDLSNIQVPETARIIHKNKGENPSRFPFRVSTLYLSELSEAEEKMKESKKKPKKRAKANPQNHIIEFP